MPLVENLDPNAIEFFKGIDAGTCISFEEFLMILATMELIFFYVARVPGLCKSFAITCKAVKSGKTFLGQNFDLFDDVPFVLLWIKWAEGIELRPTYPKFNAGNPG